MENSTANIVRTLREQGFTEFITGNTLTGFFHNGILLENAAYERFFVCCGFTDQLEVIAKVTSHCGTIRGIAIY